MQWLTTIRVLQNRRCCRIVERLQGKRRLGAGGIRLERGNDTMLYLLAIVLPPVAVLLCGKPFQAILNLLLTCRILGAGDDPCLLRRFLVPSGPTKSRADPSHQGAAMRLAAPLRLLADCIHFRSLPRSSTTRAEPARQERVMDPGWSSCQSVRRAGLVS